MIETNGRTMKNNQIGSEVKLCTENKLILN